MATYTNGSSGEDVVRIQKALQEAGLYQGALDGAFGDRTGAAVKAFQAQAGLTADGIVGPATWGKLFPAPAPVGAQSGAGDLATRCLALTGSFETGRLAPDCFASVTGNFDGQGMSFGALQWNFGQGTLQPLLQEMFSKHPDVAASVFGANLAQLQQAVSGDKAAALSFAVSIQDPVKKAVINPWRRMFTSLGLSPEFQAIEVEGAAAYARRGVALCQEYGLWTDRGRALMFDICVQNGSIADNTKALILGDFANLPQSLSPEGAEVARMRSVANRRAEAANSRFVEDVRTRKLCIAEGQGTVHGVSYDLARQFGLTLGKADTGS